MKIIAAIRKAPFALDAEYDQLCSDLVKAHNLSWMRKIDSLQELEFWRDYDPTSKILWFENAAVRFEVDRVIQALSKQGVDVVYGKRGPAFGRSSGRNQVLGFTAGSIKIVNNNLTFNYHHLFPFEMSAAVDNRFYQIYVVGYKRPEYLRLALTSTFNAFAAYQNKSINLVINDDQGQFDSILPLFPHLNVIRYKKNAGFNTLYELVKDGVIKKGVFFYFEDDFVLPADLETSHPLWAREFYDMASNGGFVGWRAAIYPHEYNTPSFWGDFNLKIDQGKRWIFNFGAHRILTGYGFANHTDNILRASQLTTKITDEFLTVFSRFDASPTLVGHHLGINKYIDYPS